MNCLLCDKLIQNYHPEFNHLQLDESHEVDICSECVDKFLKWQQSVFASLFPTTAVKKRYGKKETN